MANWRFFATRVNGDGTETMLAPELPFASSATVTRTLSGPDSIMASIEYFDPRMIGADGLPLFKPWSTAIYAERDGEIITGGFVASPPMTTGEEGQGITIECTGFSSLLSGQPFLHDKVWIGVDSALVSWQLWSDYQGRAGGKIPIYPADHTGARQANPPKSGVLLGKKATQTRNVVTTTTTKVDPKTKKKITTKTSKVVTEDVPAEPYRLSYYSTLDMGQEFDNLAKTTPFDYRMVHRWGSGDGAEIEHLLCYMTRENRGVARPNLRLVMGENVIPVPSVGVVTNKRWTQVLVLGPGEGTSMLRAGATATTRSSVSRTHVIEAKDVKQQAQLNALASHELRKAELDGELTSVTVRNSPLCPIGTWDLGDALVIEGPPEGWAEGRSFVGRVVAEQYNPDQDTVTLTLVNPNL